MRNKAKNFPNVHMTHAPDDQSEYSNKRPNGTINNKPQERAARSRHRDVNNTGRNYHG
ncbi:small, acid-soluble spore protein K [Halobacillus halophilus]|uniref:small acid-soluble spore protein K n=1 Tax=Halobacillus TaxID=45667 RepID=UPI00136A8FD7|nr:MULTISPECIES: small acid-soluble spore protein K [Halobacillus]MCA1024154.1 small, acid-soluble spore protein K [Halobacillus litoralis]MYL30353.1 small, acid-soluble spore protein K [Halobacillus halophilus]